MEKTIVVPTHYVYEALDITEQVIEAAKDYKEGFLFLTCQHTTAALRMGVNFPEAVGDNVRTAINMFGYARPYLHHGKDGPNAEGHMYSFLHGADMIIPIVDGELKLGKLQKIFFMETSGPRNRKVRMFNIK